MNFTALRLATVSVLAVGTALGAKVPTPAYPEALPAGEIALADLGAGRVFWQSYGQDPVAMPAGWIGHFDSETGVSFTPWGRVLGRDALLLHSPWRVPPGITRVDYTLPLPRITPIRLSFGIAMGADVATPDRSDGVTFSCSLLVDGNEQELMRQHHDRAQWRDYSFDLSAHAGRTIGLRLQVEPGPKNNASFDYSFFGGAQLEIGDAPKDPKADLRRQTSTRTYRAIRNTSLRPLANRPEQGVVPGNRLPFRNRLENHGASWRFVYEAKDADLTYTYAPSTGTLDDFTVQVDQGRPFQPAVQGGATVILTNHGQIQSLPARGGRPLAVWRTGDTLNVDWSYDLPDQRLVIRWTFRILGKALAVTACCDDPIVSQFTLGDLGSVLLRRQFAVPYLAGHLTYLSAQHLFVHRYLDWTLSHASLCPQATATYSPKTDGTRNPLVECGFIAISPDLGEVLPNIPHPPSPYLGLLGPRIMLDIWGHHGGTFAGDAENLRDLKDHGVDHLVIIQHDWQRYGYDVKLPDHYPANPRYGGDEGLRAFSQAARDCGYIWSLHENYIDLYPDAPSYDPTARVLVADGSPSKAWYNPGTKVQSFGLKCTRALEFARQNSPAIHERYQTTAAYLDVHSCVPPWHQLDHEASQPMAAMARSKVRHDTALFQFERDTHRGPLFGEGNQHFYWAGVCDGVEAQVNGGEDHTPLLDFDLLKLHPQMVNHGMGYYERWFRKGYDSQWGLESGSPKQMDQYRAQELAYGHAGFLGNLVVDNVQWVAREHHLMHPVQRLYGTARVLDIAYEIDGRMVSASVAVVAGDTRRQRIRYDSGLTLWINWRPEPWTVECHVLPQWGFLALGPDTRVSTSLHHGNIADYAECPAYVFADARTHLHMPHRRARKDIEPRLHSFEDLGDGRVRLSYEWIINETLEDDLHCFVHGLRPQGSELDGIEFQQDHALPKPTSQWCQGERVVDGPYEMRIPDHLPAYDLTIGLFKGPRVLLKGHPAAASRILIARLKNERDASGNRRVASEPPELAGLPAPPPETDFADHLNAEGTWIDFGPLATDGSVKINRGQDQLTVFPYPRERRFRVSLDLRRWKGAGRGNRAQVRALAPRTLADLGLVESRLDRGRLVFETAMPGAGRYVVSWRSPADRP